MNEKVFLSYSSADRPLATKIRQYFESKGITCWQDITAITAGSVWKMDIVTAIESCSVMVLVFSHHSNQSRHIATEVHLASEAGKIIIPYRIDPDVYYKGTLKYDLALTQWLDGLPPDEKCRLEELLRIVKNQIEALASVSPMSEERQLETEKEPLLENKLEDPNLSSSFEKNNDRFQLADPCALDWGRPALHYALDSAELVEVLIKLGANANQVSEYHELASPRQGENFQYHENSIRYACKIGAMPEVIKVLLDAGADPLLPNSEGDTAWDFVSNFLHKAPAEPIPSGSEGSAKRKLLQDRTALYEDTARLLKPIVMATRFDLFISSDKSSGWGEFYRGRLEQTGKRIWSSDLLKRRLPYYGEVMEAHIANAPAAVVFLSPMHFGANQVSAERKREMDALVKRFSSMPGKLLIVTASQKGKALLAEHPELNPFSSFHLETGKVNELWATLAALCGLSENQATDAFLDLRQINIPSYDCFISYRTVSVHTVRFLAEQLVALGAKPWFAEWEILVSGRRGFQEAINRGIASSNKVICCTNSDYAQSEYCQIEAMQVLDVPGKESRHILDLRIPEEPNALSDALQKYGSESVIHDERELQNTWESCCRFLGVRWDSLPERTRNREVNRFEVAGRPFQIAMDTKWEVKKVGKQIRGGNTVIALFSQKIGSVTLEGELVIGPWAISLPGKKDVNDRDMFEAIIATIREWNRYGKILYPRGVHVVHVPALHVSQKPIAHPAFTYLDSGMDSGEQEKGLRVPLSQCTWHRKYSILVGAPHMTSDMEFCFDFDMRGVAHDDHSTFCRYAYMMDDMVRGLSFG